MITDGALVVYKNKPSIVKDRADGKFLIALQDGTEVKVRDKDIELLHPGPVKNFSVVLNQGNFEKAAREVWELLLDDGSEAVPLKELASLVCGEYTPSSAYLVFCLLQDGLYFSGTISAVTPCKKENVAAEESKRAASMRELTDRAEFLERIKKTLKKPAECLPPSDARYMQDVEALACGKSVKSRTMKELGLGETPEDAHALLLKTNIWTPFINPHPSRFSISLSGAAAGFDAPLSDEQRRDLTSLASFAIDSPWSNDPDDAVSIDVSQTPGQYILYVHVADPASSITFDSPAEKEARNRGVTVYLPEGAVRMLADDSIPVFALGLTETSFALTFKLIIDEDGFVKSTEIFPSIVKVKRISYEDADKEMDLDTRDAAALRALVDLARKICARRTANGAVNIELPDVHIIVENETVNIEPIIEYKSSFLIKECMIAAGEGAGTWAASRGLAFPYISQEVEIQNDQLRSIRPGIALSMQLRRCMRPRILSVKPGRHQGLGLDTYSQVTSPLRRYTDLLAHIQIRAVLRGSNPLSADDVSARLGYCEAASLSAVHAERACNNHWIMVYLSGKKESIWDAVAIENKGNRWSVIIPSLALETQVSLQKDVSPNDYIKLALKSVNIPRGEAVFVQV